MSGSASSVSSKLTLKLVVDTKASKVLFAEAEKVFVDFVLGILALPVGALVRLIKEKEDVVGSLGALYNSVDKLNDAYMKTHLAKSLLLQKGVVVTCHGTPVPALKWDGARAYIKELFRCSCPKSCEYVTDETTTPCPKHAGAHLNSEISFVGQHLSTGSMGLSGDVDFVKGPVTFMVMDDLCVQPMSSAKIWGVTISVEDANRIKEITVHVGFDEVSRLLKAALNSKNVLTDVFLKGSLESQNVFKCWS
uniref:Uncharacterized protein n=1 Tax=Kalanchoe fedtschenkoi TaxID=63787 RepID=A0A7N0VDP1_KALFE